jgi:hypothetical protein
MFVTVVTCEMNILTMGEAQLSHWVVGQTPASAGLKRGFAHLPQIAGFYCSQKKKAPACRGSGGSRADFEVDQATSNQILPQPKIAECDHDHIPDGKLFSSRNFPPKLSRNHY